MLDACIDIWATSSTIINCCLELSVLISRFACMLTDQLAYISNYLFVIICSDHGNVVMD